MPTFITYLKGLMSGSPAKIVSRGSAAPQSPDRSTRRRRLRMRYGYLTCPAMPAYPPQACMIKEASASGASIELLVPLPDADQWGRKVCLYFDTEKEERLCQMIWHKGLMMGLKFESGPRSATRAYGRASL